MKGIKYSRFSQSFHWSQSVGENLIYFPEANAIVYNGTGNGKQYKGITSDAKFIEEAKEYTLQVKNGEIKKFLNEEHEEVNTTGVDISKIYSPKTLIARNKTYIKEIPERKEENKTIMPITIYNFEEVEINITADGIKEIFQTQIDYTMKKIAFEEEQKIFETNIANINNLIIKKED